MATGWIIKRNNKENGPFSSQQLKQFAASGKLKPEDLLRKQSGGNFQRANSIKGLFPEEALENADAGDSAEFANFDISRYGDLPMEEEDDYGDDGNTGGGKRGTKSKSGGKAPPRAGGKRKKGGKGKSGKKNKVSWEDDPINDFFWGSILICIAIGTLFFMDPETYVLPEIMITVHQYTGRFGVSVCLLLISLIFWIPAFQKVQRIQEKGQKIPWHLPNLGWFVAGLFSGSEEDEEE